MYRDFAWVYDKLMDDIDYEAWFNYIEEIFIREKVKVDRILEMAAGTGNLSVYLAEKNYNLTCFDLSFDMLSILDRKLNKYKNVKILNQDMVTFNTGGKYEAILCICDSINYITDYGNLKKVFENVYRHLEEGGIFIFDINSSYKLREIIGENTFVEDREDIFYSWENYQLEDKIVQFYINFFVKDGENYKRFIEEHYERAYEIEEILSALRASGFENINYYKAFGFDQVDESTERINFVVRK